MTVSRRIRARTAGKSGRTPIAVPASWNEQLPELDSFLGPAWYERTVWAPLGLTPRQRVCLRFGSVNYSCEVYFNGERAGAHEGGHLPFEVDVTCLLRSSGEPNLLVLRVGDRQRSRRDTTRPTLGTPARDGWTLDGL